MMGVLPFPWAVNQCMCEGYCMGAVSGVDLLWGQGQEQVFGDPAHGPGLLLLCPQGIAPKRASWWFCAGFFPKRARCGG